jgi:hypothetical protein
MLSRHSMEQPPQVIFTYDFHQLVQGQPHLGDCLFKYDPFRVVPEHEYNNPRLITAYVICHPKAEPIAVLMQFARGATLKRELIDMCGDGLMLHAPIPMPAGTERLECWFTYDEWNGHRHYDSNFGRNFQLRFPLHDIISIKAQLVPSNGSRRISVDVDSITEVQRMRIRWRITNTGAKRPERIQTELDGTIKGDRSQWKVPDNLAEVVLDSGSTIAFDIVYTVDGIEYTDDNEGAWYIATEEAVTSPKK